MTKEDPFDNVQDRLAYVKQQWECQNHCPSCGKCHILKGRDPETLYSRAVNSRCPKTRYLIGFGAKPLVLLHTILPARWFDWMMMHAS